MVDDELQRLITQLETAAPAERIGFREPILAFGTACIVPLEGAVSRRPALIAHIAAWFVLLAQREPAAQPEVERALRRLARGPDGHIPKAELDRLAQRDSKSPGQPRRAARTPKRDAGAEVHARVLQAAKARRLIVYSELETSRGHIGGYLHRIVQEEADAGHPPLTAIVVSKSTGRPGDGFLPAMIEIGYAQPGETLSEVWNRAVAEVLAFWGEGDR